MANPDSSLRRVSPATVLREIAGAVPADCRRNMIIIGSLAVGYHYFAGRKTMPVRTKDADCLLSPHVEAVPAGVAITERLLDEAWRLKDDEQWGKPGNASTPDEELPAVRLRPPGTSEWFIELLTVPESPSHRARRWIRLKTRYGDFGLCSFGYLSLPNFKPVLTDMGIQIARPEMMALANLLEHPEIGPETMAGGFAGRLDIKRSNKDLGRVLAIARLAVERNEDALLDWPGIWKTALRDRFPDDWAQLARRAGQGLKALLASEADLEQAWHTCAYGMLASDPPTLIALRIAGERLLRDAVEPMETEMS